MRIISFIEPTQPDVIKKILKHLDLWDESSRDPPEEIEELVYEVFEDE